MYTTLKVGRGQSPSTTVPGTSTCTVRARVRSLVHSRTPANMSCRRLPTKHDDASVFSFRREAQHAWALCPPTATFPTPLSLYLQDGDAIHLSSRDRCGNPLRSVARMGPVPAENKSRQLAHVPSRQENDEAHDDNRRRYFVQNF